MDDTEVRAAKRRVAWLMVPVGLVALVAAAIVFFAVWGFTHPDMWGP
jgi:hypothetical protein